MESLEEVKLFIVSNVIPYITNYYKPSAMDNLFNSCTNQDITKYGRDIFPYIKIGRSMLSRMIDYGIITTVRVGVSSFDMHPYVIEIIYKNDQGSIHCYYDPYGSFDHREIELENLDMIDVHTLETEKSSVKTEVLV